ncbi:chromosome segregation protein SMC [Xylanimonas cellulosilytica DSM 15894]|uniref:Chromosome partition protein Smc n=1 Tax=Xylanimonas cellulosilytica (strain DSM 15894 / JCM 12276 / CECT 5975 / KCTC 9989 / LMG 20990 / NBRC 107835 / XIL07) TaxID=446471 RepID=D1BZN6_XYLCX|nr:chromosome segregation protein SMC [Xylanimonas cellulosilytica]ACZ30190.1 chromosome segregation protein SMC [Xylanimonas cellulosilytica DSM 15894]
MHLKTLTLRGFKSFASATTLSFEPGITCVVGPNGSGKSNVVDALAWVMGEQGARSLRGGKMEDVIFAGTAGRPPLGRAEVSLTIDNTDGALPIDYTEVTISRTLFRSGGSEYAINGSACRLLDIQELLSDSGIGREMHVVVGQGQLDAVLRASPEERRGFVEEAAGVLKHRKRKEKALRKLDQMAGNLARLTDLTAELRRQLGPLGRQAEAARKARTFQADLRDAKARLLADDLAQLLAQLEAERADEAVLRERQQATEQALDAARAELARLEVAAAGTTTTASRAADTFHALGALRERLRGTQTLAEERVRLLGTAEPEQRGQDPADLEAQAERARAAEAELNRELDLARAALATRVEARTAAEESAHAAERELAALHRGAADRREGLARLAGQVAARRSRVEAADAELERVRAALEEAERRERDATREFAALETQVVGAEAGEEGLDAEHEEAAEAVDAARAAVVELEAAAAAADKDRASATARVEALELGLDRKDGVGALLAADLPGVLGSVAALLGIEPGYEDAVAAALGPLADALVVEDLDAAVAALRHLRAEDAGRAALVVGAALPAPLVEPTSPTSVVEPVEITATPPVEPVETPAVRAVDVVSGTGPAASALRTLLAGVLVVDDLAEARPLVAAQPDVVAVTRSGDLLGGRHAAGGSAAAPSVLHLQAALDEARAQADDAVARGERARFGLVGAREELDVAQRRYDETLDRLHESDAALAAVAERLGTLGSAQRAARAEADRHRATVAQASERRAADEAELTSLAERLRIAEAEPGESEEAVAAATEAHAAAQRDATQARAAETDARLALRTSEERARAVSGRAQSLARAATAERSARERTAARARERAEQARVAAGVRDDAATALAALDRSIDRAAGERAAAEQARTEMAAALETARADVDRLAAQLRDLTDVAHRDEVARAQQLARLEQLEERAVDELGIDPGTLVEEFGPHHLVPVPRPEDWPQDAPDPDPLPYVREEQAKRLAQSERALARIGAVNPLALEEFAALEERHGFLTEQLADLKKSRQDLLQIVEDIDERVQQVFAEAYRDTAAMFEQVFPTLFPGGEGRLVLTDPSDLLTTGIDVEARPAGKKVKRLSLLSGGERSLTAVAFLVSIFKARPSPFLIMDEVEAALDDVNLGRLLEIFRELQTHSQLIVITHQKRTMEVADALYGVAMRGDGITTVISQRLREPA